MGAGPVIALVSAGRAPADWRWAYITVGLSAVAVLGYAVIAFKWYFQRKLRSDAQCRAAINRLCATVTVCVACGVWFWATDMVWAVWRVYDFILAGIIAYTWSFALRMRGLKAVDERLAQISELESSAAKYREMAEMLPHIVWTADAGGRVDFSNLRWAEYAGPRFTWVDSIHEDDREAAVRWWGAVVKGRKPARREVRLYGQSDCRTFIVSATPLVHGEAVRWLGACADIEEQKRRSAEREHRERQKMFFLNALSHDLRTPLNNVVLNAHFLKMVAKGEVEVEAANAIQAGAHAAAELVSNLLDYARTGAQEENKVERLGLASLLHQVATTFKPKAEQKGLHVTVVAEGEAECLADRAKLLRVLGNLVDNGIKYTEAGGVTLELAPAERAAERAAESAAECGSAVIIRVTDTGIGVPAKHVPYLFDEFYQVNNHERDRAKGFGMGLAICRTLARQMGGDVRLARTGAGGSTFEVLLGACPAGGRRPRHAADDDPDLVARGLQCH